MRSVLKLAIAITVLVCYLAALTTAATPVQTVPMKVMKQTSSMQNEIKIPANWMKNGCKLGETTAMISKPYPKTYNKHCKGKKTCPWPVQVTACPNKTESDKVYFKSLIAPFYSYIGTAQENSRYLLVAQQIKSKPTGRKLLVTGCGEPSGDFASHPVNRCMSWYLTTFSDGSCGIRCEKNGVFSGATLNGDCDNTCTVQSNQIRCNVVQDSCQESCFPGSSIVRLADGSHKPMSTLEVGDRVRVVDKTTGKLGYSEVYTFFKQQPSFQGSYLKLHLGERAGDGSCKNASKWELHVSANHFVYHARGVATSFSDARLIHAGKINVGDVMWAAPSDASSSLQTQAACVLRVERELASGAYAPHTLAGSIVVDNVVAHSVADHIFQGKLLSDVLGVAPEWYTLGTAHLRAMYHLGLLPKEGTPGLSHSLPLAVTSALASIKTSLA